MNETEEKVKSREKKRKNSRSRSCQDVIHMDSSIYMKMNVFSI